MKTIFYKYQIAQLVALIIYLFMTSPLYCQEDGGFLCVKYDDYETPIWILRFRIIDNETHYPVSYANVEIFSNNRDDGYRWHANREGVAVFMAADPSCIPYEGTVEITSPDYKYQRISIDRYYFDSEEDDRRIYLEGHRHNWTSGDEIPEPKEICDKISAKKYHVGVKTIQTHYGFNMVNFAPSCFEYEIELNRIENSINQPRSYERHDHRRYEDRRHQSPNHNQYIEDDCYVASTFTAGNLLNSEYVADICRGNGRPGYKYSHYQYSVRNMGTYTAYDYKCIYCKD